MLDPSPHEIFPGILVTSFPSILALLDTFCDYLEASIHQILLIRGVLPKELFERTKLFNVPIHRCRSFEVSDYIHQAISSIYNWLLDDLIEGVVLQLIDVRTNGILENFIFEVSGTSSLRNPPSNTDISYLQQTETQLESTLRQFLIKLTQARSLLGGELELDDSPKKSQNQLERSQEELLNEDNTSEHSGGSGVSWKIFILAYEVDEGKAMLNSRFPWVEPETDEISNRDATCMIPVRSYTNSVEPLSQFKLQLFVEKPEAATDANLAT